MIMGIDAEKVRPMLRLRDKILIREHVNGDADGKKQESLEKFERCDDHETARVFAEIGHRGSKIVAQNAEFLMTDTQQYRRRR